MNGLLAGELVVRAAMKREADQELEKEAASVGGALRGAGRVIQGTARGLGEGLEREIGGVAGKALRMGAEATPAVAGLGLGVYGVESALGHPGERWLRQKKEQIKARMSGQMGATRAVYNPGTGQWY
jgi:hypothetical protein